MRRHLLLHAVLAGGLFILPAIALAQAQSGVSGTDARAAQRAVALGKKLEDMIVPRIEFRATTLGDAVEFLRQESARIDSTAEPAARGVNILLKLPAGNAAGAQAVNTRITLVLSRIPLLEALKYVASQAGLKVRLEPYAVSLVPLADADGALITAVFRVPPGFIGNSQGSGFGGAGNPLEQAAGAAH